MMLCVKSFFVSLKFLKENTLNIICIISFFSYEKECTTNRSRGLFLSNFHTTRLWRRDFTHCFVAQSDNVRHRASPTVLHDDPQVTVLKVTAIISHHMRTGTKDNNKTINDQSGNKGKLITDLQVENNNCNKNWHKAVKDYEEKWAKSRWYLLRLTRLFNHNLTAQSMNGWMKERPLLCL